MKSSIWEQSFELTIGTTKGYAKRLRELLTLDKPIVSKANDRDGKWAEWANKVVALETLIREEYPKMKITLDNKVILNK